MRRIITGAALALALAAAGCGEKTLDTADLETKLKEQLGADAGVEPRGVECPEDVTIEEGKKFDCTLTAPNGDEVTVNVTLTDDEGGFEAQVPPQQ
jgi:hypothetical protein